MVKLTPYHHLRYLALAIPQSSHCLMLYVKSSVRF